ncbi:MAG: hypothetical protein D6705_02855 [Deltaproteobacteria bacterium]|nr:MAG: hypothetical protein D6705_02855 [Deltaproteobacteria bacterium]
MGVLAESLVLTLGLFGGTHASLGGVDAIGALGPTGSASAPPLALRLPSRRASVRSTVQPPADAPVRRPVEPDAPPPAGGDEGEEPNASDADASRAEEDSSKAPPDATTPSIGDEAEEAAPSGAREGASTETETSTAADDAASEPEAGAEELSLEDIFGDASDVPAAEATPSEAGEASAERPKGGLRLPGTLDTRIRIVTSAYFDVDRADEPGFSRNENRLEFYFAYSPNEHIQIVGDVEPVFLGIAQAQELGDLATRQMLTPFHVESDAAYVAVHDLLPGLDIKVGRQILVWGTADKFNPTNNLNPDDLEDRPLFTEPIANQMVVVDVAPWGDKVWFEGVYIPLFYPALLPPSASAALKDPQSPVPFAEYGDLRTIHELQERLDANEALVPKVKGHIVQPKPSFRNSQAAFKIGWSFWEVDMSLSYYYGRHDIPTPVNVESTQVRPSDPAITPPEQLHAECCFVSDAFLEYPRMQVVGYDFAAQLPFLGDLGIWGEMGLFIPERKTLRIEFPVPILVDGELRTEMEGVTIRKTPFVKATAGMDYTFGKHVYVQAQYLRGFIDEFGVDHIGNYLVAGTDLIFFGRHLIFRLFGVVDFPTGRKDFLGRKDKGSAVIFPEILMVPPWGFVTFELGGFVFLGDETTKFGQKATGSSIVFLKATGQF